MESGKREKYEKIYRENPSSPVLLKLASADIEINNFGQAIELLEDGVNKYPDYGLIYILLGKAYTGRGNFKNALLNFKKGSELLKSEKTYKYYLKEIENEKRKIGEKEELSSSLNSMDLSELLVTSSAPSVTTVEPVDIDENLISETLAKIYLTQGETKEAVRVYEKLMKRYPLKKIYYETRIKEIKSA